MKWVDQILQNEELRELGFGRSSWERLKDLLDSPSGGAEGRKILKLAFKDRDNAAGRQAREVWQMIRTLGPEDTEWDSYESNSGMASVLRQIDKVLRAYAREDDE